MVRTLRELLARFLAKPPGEIGIYVIHLARSVGREEWIRRLEEGVGPIERFHAIEGKSLVGHPTKCAFETELIRTPGEIGCLVSHVELMRRALSEGKSHAVIFEDDCALGSQFSLESIEIYLADVKHLEKTFGMKNTNDFLLFGTAGCYNWRFITDYTKATNNFNGSHAYMVGRQMMEKFVKTYEFLLSKNLVYAVDGILGLLLRLEGFWALCPDEEKGLFVQNRSLPSYVLHDGDGLRNE